MYKHPWFPLPVARPCTEFPSDQTTLGTIRRENQPRKEAPLLPHEGPSWTLKTHLLSREGSWPPPACASATSPETRMSHLVQFAVSRDGRILVLKMSKF